MPASVPARAIAQVLVCDPVWANDRALKIGKIAARTLPGIAPIELTTAKSGSKTEISDATKYAIR